MEVKSNKVATLKSVDNCGICGTPLIYHTKPELMSCAFCGESNATNIFCPEGHYVCSSCHEQEAIEILRQLVRSTDSKNPFEIIELFMSHTSVPMHGPEHHAMVPAAIVAAVKNAGYPVPEGAVDTAIERGAKIPGGWCGYYGACGAGIGVGVAVSAITEATPLTGKTRSLAIESTSLALAEITDGFPRCCKRSSRKALEAAVVFLRENMNIVLDPSGLDSCRFVDRNAECVRKRCSYFSAS